jgi:hypothetical protein
MRLTKPLYATNQTSMLVAEALCSVVRRSESASGIKKLFDTLVVWS